MTKQRLLNNRIIESLIGFSLSVCIISASFVFVFAQDKTDKETESSEAQSVSTVSEEEKKLLEKKKAAENDLEDKLKSYSDASKEVENITSRISSLEEKIVDVITEIKKLQGEIDEKEQEIERLYNEFKGRLKTLYMTGNYTAVEVLLSAADYSDMYVKLEMIQAVAEKDNASIEKMQKTAAQLEKTEEKIKDDRAKLEVQEAELAENKSSLEIKKAEAASAYNSGLEALREIDEEAGEKASAEEISAEQEEVEDVIAKSKAAAVSSAEIAKALREGSKDVDNQILSGGGQFCFPVPSCTDISCGYYGYTNHNGIDFSNASINGKKIVAAADGKVVTVKRLNRSYGFHVWIDHGDGLLTLYAHQSRIIVKEGQYVRQGDVIGYVGTTGNSTGPHLHFGVLLNGKFVNPINYF